MVKKKSETVTKKMVKIVYFDEGTAQDYIDIANDGRLDWNEAENKERLTRIAGEVEAAVGGGFNFFSYVKATMQGSASGEYNRETKKIIERRLNSTLLTEYIRIATDDDRVSKFNGIVSPPDNSISKYVMYSPYSIIIPKDQVPIDLERLNEALDSARGYYEMLHTDKNGKESVLRFNDIAFRNNYNLSDLTKMNLKFFAIKVGSCRRENLDMAKEFDFSNEKEPPTAEEVLDETTETSDANLPVFDVVIAGVENE